MDPYGRLKEATKWMWALGDYRELARFLEPHAEALAKAVAVQPGMKVLDVAAGNGNFAIAAAKSGANVTATDLTPKMIELGRLRTDAANLGVEWREADAEALPFAGERFDLVWSRWPTIPPAGLALPSPFDWGDPSVVPRRFAGMASSLDVESGVVTFSFPSLEEGWNFWERTNPPLIALKSMAPPDRFQEVVDQGTRLMRGMNAAGDSRLVLESEYIQVVARQG